MDSKIAGSIAGAVATVPMTAVMNAFERWQDLPPHVITQNATAEAAGTPLEETSAKALSMTAHFGVGATMGAGYGAFAGQSGLPPAAEGALYGVAVWGGAYLGLLPESGLFPHPTEDRKSRTLAVLGAHVVWGAALGVVWDVLSRRTGRWWGPLTDSE
jgi:putative membrane protein